MRGIVAVCLCLAGCALEAPPPTTGYLPDGAFGNAVLGEDPAVAATQDALVAFAYPAQLRGHPARMALAVASLDAMAGQFSTGGRWLFMDDTVKLQMLDARDKVRKVLGIPPAAASQEVIDRLVTASRALDRGDEAGAQAALSGRDFTLGPMRTLTLLTYFPKVPAANYATQAADQNLFPNDNDSSGGLD